MLQEARVGLGTTCLGAFPIPPFHSPCLPPLAHLLNPLAFPFPPPLPLHLPPAFRPCLESSPFPLPPAPPPSPSPRRSPSRTLVCCRWITASVWTALMTTPWQT